MIGFDEKETKFNMEEARRLVSRSTSIVALTGAGISRASGIPLMDGYMKNRPIRELFERSFLHGDPKGYYTLYREVLEMWRSAVPNAAHHALARQSVKVITLNIDGLHRDAGGAYLIEMHGNLRELHCAGCVSIFSSQKVMRELPPRCPHCNAVLTPGFSMAGDEVRHFSLAMDWVGRADLLLIVGTSLHDAPADQFPRVAETNKTPTIVVEVGAERVLPALLKSE